MKGLSLNMNYVELFDNMQKVKMISQYWKDHIDLFNSMLAGDSSADLYLKILILYFSLIDDGNVFMCLNSAELSKKFTVKIEGLKIQNEDDKDCLDILTSIQNELLSIIPHCKDIAKSPLIGDGTENVFVVQDDRLFTRKHFNAINRINVSISRLYKNNPAKTW